MKSSSPQTFFVTLLSITLLLAGCAVGPNFESPLADAPPSWSTRPTSAPGLTGQSPITEQQTPEQWWTLFNDPTLNTLQQRLAANSPDL